jgi:flagellar basal-body rod protein FlgF/flagellar basal-body rod protein FlgG
MPYGLYLSAEGAHAQSKRLEIIANNLANVDTVGFKRQLALFQARYAEATERGEDFPGSGSINDVGGGVEVRETKTDFSPGPLKHTGVPTDMAIQGDGFFLVKKGEETFLTRAGDFFINQRGELMTQYGQEKYSVLNDAGAAVVIDPNIGPWHLTPSGAIQQAGSLQNLAIVKPTSLGDLVNVGENVFRPLAEVLPVPANQRNVAGGYLEMSAVQPTMEMIEMIEASRAVEANINMMQTQDQMLAGLISRVMRTV